jgi:hypothetical protein
MARTRPSYGETDAIGCAAKDKVSTKTSKRRLNLLGLSTTA